MTISSVNQLVANIRSQLAAGTAGTTTAARKSAGSKSGGLGGNSYDAQNLEGLIGQRIRQIERDAPNRGKKAFRVFLEAVLLSQLGEELINDPKFYQLLDDVQGAIEHNPETRVWLEHASAQLIKEN